MRPQLIQSGIEHSRGSLFGQPLAVDVKADAGGLVPGEREMHPLVRLGEIRHRIRNARPTQVHVGDKGIKAVAVVIDAQPYLVPTGVIGISHAEDGKLSLVYRVARPPKERKRPALRIDVARRPIRKQLVVAALQIRTLRAAGKNLHVRKETALLSNA